MNDNLKDMTYGEQLEYLDAYARLLTEGFRQCDKIHSKMRIKKWTNFVSVLQIITATK